MKKLFSKFVWLQLILSILLLFGGTLVIVFAVKDETVLKQALNIIVAVIMFIFGGFAILTTFLFERKSAISYALIYGSAAIALGVFLCINNEKGLYILDYLVYMLSIFFIVIGAIELIKAIVMTVKVKPAVWVLILAYLFSVVFIAGGILSLVFADKVQTVFCFIAGALLFLLGVYELVEGVKEMIAQIRANPDKQVKQKPSKKDKKQGIVDQEPVVEEQAEEQEIQAIEQQPEPEIKELDYTSNQIEQKKTDD